MEQAAGAVAPQNRRDEAEGEDELPGKQIEEPAARFRPVRQVEAEDARSHIEAGRNGEGQERSRRATASAIGAYSMSTT
jgi:hypothetical protein